MTNYQDGGFMTGLEKLVECLDNNTFGRLVEDGIVWIKERSVYEKARQLLADEAKAVEPDGFEKEIHGLKQSCVGCGLEAEAQVRALNEALKIYRRLRNEATPVEPVGLVGKVRKTLTELEADTSIGKSASLHAIGIVIENNTPNRTRLTGTRNALPKR